MIDEILDQLLEKMLANPRSRAHKQWKEGYLDALFDIKSECKAAEEAGDTARHQACQNSC
jgi:hypothetical protein